MTYPQLSAPTSEDPPFAGPSGGEAGPSARSRTTRVLIVEDEWLVAMDIESALEEAGFEVVGIARSADEAVRLAEQHRPDLALMDIRISGARDGIDAALEINRRFGLRPIFVSAFGDPATRERAQGAQPLGWVPKPFSSRQLIATITEALRDL
jgi:two-component system, response regulator PdtaR